MDKPCGGNQDVPVASGVWHMQSGAAELSTGKHKALNRWNTLLAIQVLRTAPERCHVALRA